MIIRLYHNNEENNKISKSITLLSESTIVNKKVLSVDNPVIYINNFPNLFNCNYAYIPEFNRYYFVKTALETGGIVELTLNTDVLMSYKSTILNLKGIVDKQQQRGNSNVYLNDGSYVVQSNEFNEVKTFPNGFNNNGTYILICAGG